MTVRACSRYLRTESSRSCQISKARSSPSTWSFRSMLLSCGRRAQADCWDADQAVVTEAGVAGLTPGLPGLHTLQGLPARPGSAGTLQTFIMFRKT